MAVSDEIHERLTAALQPKRLEIRDDSESHRGHAGFKEGGESHFHVTISADKLDILTRVGRHRAVHTAIGPELMARIHALELKIET